MVHQLLAGELAYRELFFVVHDLEALQRIFDEEREPDAVSTKRVGLTDDIVSVYHADISPFDTDAVQEIFDKGFLTLDFDTEWRERAMEVQRIFFHVESFQTWSLQVEMKDGNIYNSLIFYTHGLLQNSLVRGLL